MSPVKQMAGNMDFGIVGLFMKGIVAEELVIIPRNSTNSGRNSLPPVSNTSKCQSFIKFKKLYYEILNPNSYYSPMCSHLVTPIYLH
jgi:hypothetical protein